MADVQASVIDELLEDAVRRGAAPGFVAVVAAEGGLLYERSVGRLSVAGDAPVRPDTVFRIASMTKAITTVAVLQLVENGKVDLDASVASLVPDHASPPVLEGFEGGRPQLRAAASPPTVRQLLSHTSGHGYFFLSPELGRYHEVTAIPTWLSGSAACLGTPLIADPGTRWEYGISTDWAGRVVEAVTGQGLDAYLDEHVFRPLGMSDTTFWPDDAARQRMMALHARTPEGGLALSEIDLPEFEFAAGGGGLYATAGDYARFMRALLRGGELDGERILAEETVELAFSDQLNDIALPGVMRSTVPELSNDVPSPPFRQGWGLGFHLTLEDVPGMRRAGTGDWAGLFNCYYWIDRASGIAAALFTQLLPFFDAQVVETLLALEQAAYANVHSAAPAA